MTTATELIDFLGGTSSVAKLLGIKAPSVSEWRRTGIPRSRIGELALATGRAPSSLSDLLPERWHLLWPELAKGVRSGPTTSEAMEISAERTDSVIRERQRG